MEWNVYYFDCNKQEIMKYNVFKHSYVTKEIKEHIKTCTTKYDLIDRVTSILRYYFWSKAEWELILSKTEDNKLLLTPWCGCCNPEKVTIDVTNDNLLDWNEFLKVQTNNYKYHNEAKIDVFDQVTFRFNEFINYIWNNFKN